MSDSDCDMPEFSFVSEPRARIKHRCCECTAPIRVGEKYVRCSGKWAGDVSTFKQHTLCAEACESIRDNSGECIAFGSLKEWWSEAGNDSKYHIKNKTKYSEHYIEIRKMLAVIFKRERIGM